MARPAGDAVRGNPDHTTREAVLGILSGVDGELPVWMIKNHVHKTYRISKEAVRETVQRLWREGKIQRTRRGYYQIGESERAGADNNSAPLGQS